MKELFILVEDQSEYNNMIDTMFYDCRNVGKFLTIVENETKSKIIQFLKKSKIQKYTNGILNFLIVKKFNLYNILKENTSKFEKIYVIFLNSSFLISRYPCNVLKKFKSKWNNIKYILFYIDIIEHPVSKHANMLRKMGIFDWIYTVDEGDSIKYNLNLFPTPYSVIDKYKTIIPKNDIYFCGVTKDRGNKIKKILDAIEKNNITTKMDIFCNSMEYKNMKTYKKIANIYENSNFIPYFKVLEKTLQSRCILELVQENQKALTLRAYEAIAYNRKLLTNCKTILSFKYYNPAYIQYFENISDIDWNWVKKDINIDYKYNGEFSPKRLINDIKKKS